MGAEWINLVIRLAYSQQGHPGQTLKFVPDGMTSGNDPLCSI